MCRRVACPHCHRPTFAGCGAHVEQVLGDVPKEERCHCATKKRGGEARPSIGEPKPSWWQKLLSR